MNLPPLHTLSGPTPMTERRFDASLVSWQNPTFGLTPLGHLRSQEAPRGVVHLEGQRLPKLLAPDLLLGALGAPQVASPKQLPLPPLVLRTQVAPKAEVEPTRPAKPAARGPVWSPPTLPAQPASAPPPPPPAPDSSFVRGFSEPQRRFPDTVSRYEPAETVARPIGTEGSVAQLGVAPVMPTVVYQPERVEQVFVPQPAPALPSLPLAMPAPPVHDDHPTKGRLRMGEPLDERAVDAPPPPPAATEPVAQAPQAAEPPPAPASVEPQPQVPPVVAPPVLEAAAPPAPAVAVVPPEQAAATAPAQAPLVSQPSAPSLSDRGDTHTTDTGRSTTFTPSRQATPERMDLAAKAAQTAPSSGSPQANTALAAPAPVPPVAAPPVTAPPAPAATAAGTEAAQPPAAPSPVAPTTQVQVPPAAPPRPPSMDLAVKRAEHAPPSDSTRETSESTRAEAEPIAAHETIASPPPASPVEPDPAAAPPTVIEAVLPIVVVAETAPLVSHAEPVAPPTAAETRAQEQQVAQGLPLAAPPSAHARQDPDRPAGRPDTAPAAAEVPATRPVAEAHAPLSTQAVAPQTALPDMPVAARPIPPVPEARVEVREVHVAAEPPPAVPDESAPAPVQYSDAFEPQALYAAEPDAALLGERSPGDLGIGTLSPASDPHAEHPGHLGDGGDLVFAQHAPTSHGPFSNGPDGDTSSHDAASTTAVAIAAPPAPESVAPLVSDHHLAQLAQLQADQRLGSVSFTPSDRPPLATVRGVPVRTGADVDATASHLNARAFTRDGEIHLPTKSLRRGSQEVDALIAHEMTHVLQQQAHGRSLPRQNTPEARALEAEAVANERAVIEGTPLTLPQRWQSAPNQPAEIPGSMDAWTADLALAMPPTPTVVVHEVEREEPKRQVLSSWSNPAFHDDEMVQLASETSTTSDGGGKGFSLEDLGDEDVHGLFSLLYPMIEARMRNELRRHRDRAGQVNTWDMK
jgi:hypothetical protein